MVDNLNMTYNGNMLTSVCDNASRMAYAGATDFDGVCGQEYPHIVCYHCYHLCYH